MATRIWTGGATAVAQVSTITISGTYNNSETDITVTLTNEGGGTQTVSIDPSGTDKNAIATALHTALAASTDTLFTAITWTVATSVVTGTAKIAGVPFYFSSAVTGGTGATVDATSTASAGPNDFATAANWESAVPVTNDIAIFNQGSYSVLYGLDQSAVNLNELMTTEGYTGSLGDIRNSYYLQIDVNGASTKEVLLDGSGANYWLDGTMPTVNIGRCRGDTQAINLKGDIDNVYITGTRNLGTINFANSMTLDNVYCLNAPQARVIIGTSVSSLDLFEFDGGDHEVKSAITTINGAGGLVKHFGDSVNVTEITLRGGAILYYNSGGTLGDTDQGLTIYNGHLKMNENEEDTVTLKNVVIYEGSIDAEGCAATITWTDNIISRGTAQITGVRGDTVNPKA